MQNVGNENNSPRAYTEDEMRDRFIESVRNIARYWATIPDVDKATGHRETIQDRCEGVAFSILALMDGDTMNMPGVNLVFCPHEDDKQYCIDEGENWVEPGTTLSTALHEFFYKK